jgi:RsbT co-antagonist protein rsbRD N-terminal domain
MRLNELLSEKKSIILGKWFDVIIASYPADTSNFLNKQENRFTNPVGHVILQGIEGIYDAILMDIEVDKVTPFLDNIIRVRAVQDFLPSQAVSFVMSLKKIIHEEIRNYKGEGIPVQELSALESRIDTLALLSFDIFMKCKEKIYEIKANEAKRMMYRLLHQANLLTEETAENDAPEKNFIDLKRKEATQ